MDPFTHGFFSKYRKYVFFYDFINTSFSLVYYKNTVYNTYNFKLYISQLLIVGFWSTVGY